MKIELSKPNKEFYDEFLYVSSYYRSKIKKNPKQKVKLISKFMYNKLLLTLIYFCISISILISNQFLNNGNNALFFYCICFFTLFAFLIVFKSYKAFMKAIDEYIKSYINCAFEINENGISAEKENKQCISLNWDSIDKILINKHSIIFYPKDINVVGLGISSDYKDIVIKSITEYSKEYLLIDNTSLYNK